MSVRGFGWGKKKHFFSYQNFSMHSYSRGNGSTSYQIDEQPFRIIMYFTGLCAFNPPFFIIFLFLLCFWRNDYYRVHIKSHWSLFCHFIKADLQNFCRLKRMDNKLCIDSEVSADSIDRKRIFGKSAQLSTGFSSGDNRDSNTSLVRAKIKYSVRQFSMLKGLQMLFFLLESVLLS